MKDSEVHLRRYGFVSGLSAGVGVVFLDRALGEPMRREMQLSTMAIIGIVYLAISFAFWRWARDRRGRDDD